MLGEVSPCLGLLFMGLDLRQHRLGEKHAREERLGLLLLGLYLEGKGLRPIVDHLHGLGVAAGAVV